VGCLEQAQGYLQGGCQAGSLHIDVVDSYKPHDFTKGVVQCLTDMQKYIDEVKRQQTVYA
jgi:hypothetical protein